MESTTLTRSQLYELVWKEPMLALSKQFDISDVGLRKNVRPFEYSCAAGWSLAKSEVWERFTSIETSTN